MFFVDSGARGALLRMASGLGLVMALVGVPAGAAVDCSKFVPVDTWIDGKKVQRYDVSSPQMLACLPPQPAAPWVVTRDRWTPDDELRWQNFVSALGRSRCNSIDSCLLSSANPYRDEIDEAAIHYTDCADFPMYLRAYFAYKNQLPFSMVFSYRANELTPEQNQQLEERRREEEQKGQLEAFERAVRDSRYSLNGNQPTSRYGVPHLKAAARDFFDVSKVIHNNISSGSYRMYESTTGVEPDFYSPRLTPESIVPGTVIYRVEGHIALVYEVTPDGDIKYIDAHPDNSVSRGVIGRDFVRSTPSQGGGFKKWRPFYLTNVQRDRQGAIVAGRPVFTPNTQLADFSLDQYFGNQPDPAGDWKKGRFTVQGSPVTFLEFLRLEMSGESFRLRPLEQFKKDLGALCEDLQGRREAVQKAVDRNLDDQPHPEAFPLNIFGAQGDWEAYSTPGRDLRIRRRTLDLIDFTKDAMKKWVNRAPYFEYEGTNLKKDFLLAYNEIDANCRISYRKSDGQEVRMSLSTALARVTRLSFDPYLCPERRWGALSPAELRSCAETADKARWYEYSQFLREGVLRDPTMVMGFTLGDLERVNRQQAQDADQATSRFNILRALRGL